MAQVSAIMVHAAAETQWSPVHLMQALRELLLLLIHLHKVLRSKRIAFTKKLHENASWDCAGI